MKKLSILFAIMLATGCASTGGSSGGSAPMEPKMDLGGSDYASVIAMAKAENDKAKKMGGLWRDAGKIIKKAEKAKKEGKDAEALKLAKKAVFQGKMGQMQAEGQKSAGPWLF